MKIKMLRSTVVGGKRKEKHDIVNASDNDARQLINMRKAVSFSEKKQKVKKDV